MCIGVLRSHRCCIDLELNKTCLLSFDIGLNADVTHCTKEPDASGCMCFFKEFKKRA